MDSQAWIKAEWEKLAGARNDIKVEYFNHQSWPQPSIIMTIEGESKGDEIVVIGGHADSIAGFWGGTKDCFLIFLCKFSISCPIEVLALYSS